MLLKNGLKFMINHKKIYNPNKEIKIKTPMLRSVLCYFSDAFIVVKGDITVEGSNNANKRNKNLVFENNVPYINYITKINSIKIDNAEDLDAVMPLYNLLEYSKAHKKNNMKLVGLL